MVLEPIVQAVVLGLIPIATIVAAVAWGIDALLISGDASDGYDGD